MGPRGPAQRTLSPAVSPGTGRGRNSFGLLTVTGELALGRAVGVLGFVELGAGAAAGIAGGDFEQRAEGLGAAEVGGAVGAPGEALGTRRAGAVGEGRRGLGVVDDPVLGAVGTGEEAVV